MLRSILKLSWDELTATSIKINGSSVNSFDWSVNKVNGSRIPTHRYTAVWHWQLQNVGIVAEISLVIDRDTMIKYCRWQLECRWWRTWKDSTATGEIERRWEVAILAPWRLSVCTQRPPRKQSKIQTCTVNFLLLQIETCLIPILDEIK